MLDSVVCSPRPDSTYSWCHVSVICDISLVVKNRMSSIDCSLLMPAGGLVCVVFVLLSSSPWYNFHRTSSRYIGPYKTPPLLSGASMEGENGLVGFPNSTLASASVCLRMLSSFQSYFVQHHPQFTVSSALGPTPLLPQPGLRSSLREFHWIFVFSPAGDDFAANLLLQFVLLYVQKKLSC